MSGLAAAGFLQSMANGFYRMEASEAHLMLDTAWADRGG